MKLTYKVVTLMAVLAAVFTGCEDQKKPLEVRTKEDVAVDLARLNRDSVGSIFEQKRFATSSHIASKLVTQDLKKVTLYSSVWAQAKSSSVMLYPQHTLESNDQEAISLMADAGPIKADAKAIYNDQDIAILISWRDTKKSQGTTSPTTFADGIAMQFPMQFSDPAKLPYIGMGSSSRGVVIHLQKAGVKRFEADAHHDVQAQLNDNALNMFGKELHSYQKKVSTTLLRDYEKIFISEGFRSLSEIKDASARGNFTMRYHKGVWKALLIRPLKDDYIDLHAEAFPMAFAIWNGNQANRGGTKYLSSWTTVGYPKSRYVAQVAAIPKGDILAGKQKAVQNCAGCHAFDDQKSAAPYMAPNMSHLGGQATADYIRESIMDPSAVIVPGYNRNAHKNHLWYTVVKGKRVSTMPSFEWMSTQDINDIIAYLKTLT